MELSQGFQTKTHVLTNHKVGYTIMTLAMESEKEMNNMHIGWQLQQ
jgi:hypothetical protein